MRFPHVPPALATLGAWVVAVSSALGIVGGGPVPAGESSWSAALITTGSGSFQGQFCGAVIVHPRWALTTAHCVAGKRTGAIEVGVGSNALSGVERIGVADIIIHPEFDPQSFEADIALVLLSEPVPDDVRPIELLDQPALIVPDAIARVSGWGATDPTGNEGSFPDALHAVDVPIVDNSIGNVASIYNGALTERMLIAGYRTGGAGFCLADAGGALTVRGARGRAILAGLASFGRPGVIECAGTDSYSGFTKIPAFREWIQSYTRPDYHAWESDRGLMGALRDGDADGTPNFNEFAAAADLWIGGGQLTVGEVEVEGRRYPAIETLFREDSEELEHGVEFSTDFDTWEPLDLDEHLIFSAPIGDGGASRVVVRAPLDSEELAGGGAFFRQLASPSEVVSHVDREISAPGYAYSSLSPVDDTDIGGTFYKDFAIRSPAGPGEWNAVLRSNEFDAVLQLLGDGGELLEESASDLAGGFDERLPFMLSAGANYVLRVKASGPAESGEFSLAIGGAHPDWPVAGAGVTNGMLGEGDPFDPVGLPLEFYLDQFLLEPADYERLVYAFLDSDQGQGGFDTFLRVTNAETGVRVAENDDIATGNSNSFAVFSAEPRVPYRLDATSFDVRETGPYTVTLFPLRIVTPGEAIVGRLEEADAIDSNGSFFDSYYLPAPPANTTVTVSLESDELDPFLIHFDAGFSQLAQDNDSGEGNSALISFVADGQSSYIFDASSSGVGETGNYLIEVTYGGID